MAGRVNHEGQDLDGKDNGKEDGRTRREIERSEVTKIIETTRTVASTAVSGLRDTAKWIVGGVALAAGGVIAGSSLTSLGSLGLEWRLLIAFSGAAIGFVALAVLLSQAINLLAPRTYDINTIFRWGETISARDRKQVFIRVDHSMPPGVEPIENVAAEFLRLRKEFDSLSDDDRETLSNLSNVLSLAIPVISLEHCRLMFFRLEKILLILTPVIALSFGVFAWAATPSKDIHIDIKPMVKELDVNSNDVPALHKAMAAPACLGTKLSVIVLREWLSGSQEVVTVPTGFCFPVRLRLDHGRLSPMD